MSSKKGFHLSDEVIASIANIAGQAGAKVYYETSRKEREKERKESHDRRLRNTKLLLRNYRMFKAHADNAVYTAEKTDEDAYDIIDLMSDRDSSSDTIVESIKNSVTRTVTIVRHIQTMLGIYEAYCLNTGDKDGVRRWQVINGLYIAEPPKTVGQLANDLHVTERTVYRDVSDALFEIAGLIFGIDGVKKE